MANLKQLEILQQGVDAWNAWRTKNLDFYVDLISVDLGGAKFLGANLQDADLRKADISGADLSKADLQHADLSRSNLAGVNFTQANLSDANLFHANLSGANLHGANLSRTNLFGSNLSDTSFSGVLLEQTNFLNTRLSSTIFSNLDLSNATSLEDVIHLGPSSISIDVFAFSKGTIPDVFLRGCGLSDADIEYAKLSNPQLTNEEINKILYRVYDLRAQHAVQISPLFISYSHADGAFVDALEFHLYEKGIRFWRDIHDAKAGKLEKQIDLAIHLNRIVLLILSKHSLKSDWVEHEVRTARELERKLDMDVLCPIALDDSWKNSRWPKRVMEQLSEYNILDFSAWKDATSFQKMLRKLFDGLEQLYKR